MSRPLPPGYWNNNPTRATRPPPGATCGTRNGRKWNARVLDGLDLGGVVVARRGYDKYHFVRCPLGHERLVTVGVIARHVKTGKRLECQTCADQRQEQRP